MRHRRFYRTVDLDGKPIKRPSPPFGLTFTASTASTVASTVRCRCRASGVLDFSWVIAGPTTTRYLAAMGAEVIKIEAPGRGDPGRESELHTVLGQAKKSVVLDLKKPEAVEIARALAAKSDVLIENYATGVMDRLGLGAEALKAVNPDLIYISASGMGRTGPESHAVAYGTLLQCYAGFAGLNRHPDVAPRIGFAWLDPMCGLMLAFVAAAALWHRQHARRRGEDRFLDDRGDAVDHGRASDETQLGAPPKPMGNASTRHAPHGAWRCAGDDDWISIAVRTDAEWRALCSLVPALTGLAALDLDQRVDAHRAIDRCSLAAWASSQSAPAAAEALLKRGHPRGGSCTSRRSGEEPPSRGPRILGQSTAQGCCRVCRGAPASAARPGCAGAWCRHRAGAHGSPWTSIRTDRRATGQRRLRLALRALACEARFRRIAPASMAVRWQRSRFCFRIRRAHRPTRCVEEFRSGQSAPNGAK